MIALRNVLVATDFGDAADTALLYGRAIAQKFGATLHVLNVSTGVFSLPLGPESMMHLPTLQTDLENAARTRLAGQLIDSDHSGPPAKPVVLTANAPAFTIVDYARGHAIDLIVTGTHGYTALKHALYGSVAERVVRMAPCPVLTVHHPEHEFVRPDTLAAAGRA